MNNLLIEVVAIVACSVTGSDQAAKAEEASLARLRELSRMVMTKVIAGDDAGAMELVRPNLPVPKSEFEELRSKTIEGRKLIMGRFGKPLTFKLVREERVSDFLIRLTYVEKREIHLVRWQFILYKPKAEWRLNAFSWDDNAGMLFDEKPPAK